MCQFQAAAQDSAAPRYVAVLASVDTEELVLIGLPDWTGIPKLYHW